MPATQPQDEQLLPLVCSLYDEPTASFSLIRWNSNLIYEGPSTYLRLTPVTVRQQADIAAELRWVQYLLEAGLDVVEPINTVNGEAVAPITSDSGTYLAVGFKKIHGHRIKPEEWSPAHYRRLGQLIGAMHRLSTEFTAIHGTNYQDWSDIPEHTNHTYLPAAEGDLPTLFQEVCTCLNNWPKNHQNYGVIHYDVHHGNYLLDEQQQITLLDFEMTCRGWFISDIATTFYYMLQREPVAERATVDKAIATPFWEGYTSEYRLADEERSMIPLWMLYRDLMVLAFVHKIWPQGQLNEQQQAYQHMLWQSIRQRRAYLQL